MHHQATSLVGGGFIAGESISALVLGIVGLVATVFGAKSAKLDPALRAQLLRAMPGLKRSYAHTWAHRSQAEAIRCSSAS